MSTSRLLPRARSAEHQKLAFQRIRENGLRSPTQIDVASRPLPDDQHDSITLGLLAEWARGLSLGVPFGARQLMGAVLSHLSRFRDPPALTSRPKEPVTSCLRTTLSMHDGIATIDLADGRFYGRLVSRATITPIALLSDCSTISYIMQQKRRAAFATLSPAPLRSDDIVLLLDRHDALIQTQMSLKLGFFPYERMPTR